MQNSFMFGHAHFYNDRHSWFGSMPVRRGNVRLIILGALSNKPMHGYEVMRYLEEKSDGMWRPSPGSVYPTLQLLEDEDLIIGQDKDSKKIYNISPKGKKLLNESHFQQPWDEENRSHAYKLRLRLWKAVRKTKPALVEIMQSNDQLKIDTTLKLIDELTDKIQAIASQIDSTTND